MERLSSASLSRVRSGVEVPGYAQASVTAGVVHFGAGNFHRAHQAVYCDALLNQGETDWGITGVSLRSAGMRDNLAPQDFLYTQATLGDTTAYRVIGAICNVLVAAEDPHAVIEAVARNETRLVTTTITEKGYCLSSGEIDRGHAGIQGDLESLEEPQTIYGYLAAALVRRCAEQGLPLTVLCCDNLHAGGGHLRTGVALMLERHSPATLAWAADNVAFCSSMVDRVTPATDESLRARVAERLGLYDAAPVAAEPFSQWVIEDRFAGQRPPFERAGALFVEDIAPYERIKLRFLNAAHSMLAALGYLAGDRYIHEALQRPALARFTEQTLKRTVLPVTPVPEGISGEAYIDQVLERFRNRHLPYAVLQVGSDSSLKIQQRWLPSLEDALARGQDASGLAFALAAWVSFVRKAVLNNELNDPQRDAFSHCQSRGTDSDVEAFLSLVSVGKFSFFSDAAFMEKVARHHRDIAERGVVEALDTFLTDCFLTD